MKWKKFCAQNEKADQTDDMSIIDRLRRNFTHPLAVALQNRSSKMVLVGVLAATLIFLCVSAYLNLRASRNLRNVAKTQFNDMQMVIARDIKGQVERELSFISREIEIAAQMISRSKGNIPAVREDLGRMLYRSMGNNVYRVDILDPGAQKVHTYGYPRRWRVNPMRKDAYAHLRDRLSDPDTYISRPIPHIGGMRVFLAGPAAGTDCTVIARLDVARFLGQFLRDIRSGKTGYAWVIDSEGTFLYHPYADFIGKSAFTAREERNPAISHQTINFIQKNKMLAGKKGTGSYIAGWHRGFTGKIEKLIAYVPINIPGASSQYWSVAVVAPVSEIEGYISQTHIWLFLFQAVLILVIVSAGTGILFNEIRWARELARRVDERTEALQKSEMKYRSLVESAEDFIFTVDREGRFQSMNSYTANFFGGRPADFIDRNIDHLLPPESSRKQRRLLQMVYRHERSVRDEFTLKVDKEHEVWLSANFMPIRDETGRVETVLCIARDVTHEKNLERQLINTEKLASLGTLAAGVAHEINNPLGVILGFSDLLIRKTSRESQSYEDLKTIERQGMHCKQIVENLLRFARFGEGAESHSDVNESIREIINIVFHTIEMEGIELVTELEEDIPPVRGDPRELQQVFLNLVNNACAAMNGGGTLTIRSGYETGAKKAAVEIEDTGHGIARQDLDRIFEPFFTTKPEGEGTGLGLSVTYGIVSKYGGTIDCRSTPKEDPESPEEKHGTVFIVKMPIYEAES